MRTDPRGFTITPLALIIAIAFAVGVIGYVVFILPDDEKANTNATTNNANVRACTEEAKRCPDGSYVSRTGPDCAFAECPTPTIFTNTNEDPLENQTPTSRYGLWFPYNDGQTVSNPRPVIYGKVEQSGRLYLETSFGQKDWAGRDFGGAKTLSVLPGIVQNLDITLDDQPVSDIAGFSQYPSIVCWRQNVNANGSKTYDPKTGTMLPADTLYETEAECVNALSDDLPPLIFVFQPADDLTKGSHALSVNGETMRFVYDPAFTLPAQDVPIIPDQNRYDLVFGPRDNCAPGYYQSRNDLPIALPTQKNVNLFYGISFPQSDEEQGSIRRRHVEIKIGGHQYPVFFPDQTTYIGGEADNTLFGENQLFLPLQNLVYSDGNPATPRTINTNPTNAIFITGYSYELYPIDIAGHEYRGHSLPWEMSTSSGCDG